MTRLLFVIAAATLVLPACGVVGAPVPPEDVGVTPIIERQKQAIAAGRSVQEADSATTREGAVTQPYEDLPVPPVQSVGTAVGTR